MASEVDIEIKINRGAVKALAESGEVKEGLMILGGVAEVSAKGHVRVDTGNLRRSITHELAKDRIGWFVRVGTNVFYGIYQEVGTMFHSAQPYLRPALEAVRKFLNGR